jgi:hypothetical protein
MAETEETQGHWSVRDYHVAGRRTRAANVVIPRASKGQTCKTDAPLVADWVLFLLLMTVLVLLAVLEEEVGVWDAVLVPTVPLTVDTAVVWFAEVLLGLESEAEEVATEAVLVPV